MLNNQTGFLTQEEIKDFILLVKKTKNIELTEAEALDQGIRLITIFEELQRFKPIQSPYKDIVEVKETSDRL